MLFFLYSLSLINSYKTLNIKKFKLAKHLKKVLLILLALLVLITLKKLIKSLFIYNSVYIIYNNFNYCQKT